MLLKASCLLTCYRLCMPVDHAICIVACNSVSKQLLASNGPFTAEFFTIIFVLDTACGLQLSIVNKC